jgi:hypothetical protein
MLSRSADFSIGTGRSTGEVLSSEGDRQVDWMLRRCAVYSRKQAGKLMRSAEESERLTGC